MIQMLCAHAGELPLADESVQCVVTSPPYWGLRNYAGNQELVWDAAPECVHEWIEHRPVGGGKRGGKTRWAHGGRGLSGHESILTNNCGKCGAWRGAFGLEPSVLLYVDHSIQILRELRRVLRSDGVLFWNVGDSYASGKGTCFNPGGGFNSLGGHDRKKTGGAYPLNRGNVTSLRADGLKPKDLCLIPARVALAAQADGWHLRSMIVWSKSNPMPESTDDRPTTSHEYVIMLTKSARYFWDAKASRERGTSGPSDLRKMQESLPRIGGKTKDLIAPLDKASAATNIGQKRSVGEAGWRRMRTVWEIATTPYRGAHFATFPPELPTRCILAATRIGDVVLDPFAGTGTTGRVAIALRRRVILCDLAYSQAYKDLAEDRTSGVQLEAFA